MLNEADQEPLEDIANLREIAEGIRQHVPRAVYSRLISLAEAWTKDYEDMRRFQMSYVRADKELRNAKEVIQTGVRLMPLNILSLWTGVRAFLTDEQ